MKQIWRQEKERKLSSAAETLFGPEGEEECEEIAFCGVRWKTIYATGLFNINVHIRLQVQQMGDWREDSEYTR